MQTDRFASVENKELNPCLTERLPKWKSSVEKTAI